MHFSNSVVAAGLLASASGQFSGWPSLGSLSSIKIPGLDSLNLPNFNNAKLPGLDGLMPNRPGSSKPVTPTTPTKPTAPVTPSAPNKAATPTQAANGQCPAVWNQISQELTGIFRNPTGCTDDARAIIRGVFHDCFPQGGCDGSLAIPAELSRDENVPMTSTINKLKAMATKYKVGTADMLMFAGSAAVISCPGGPTTQTFIGRVDAQGPAPANQLPTANVSAAEAKSHFANAGFSSQDLAALIGAHTASRQFNTDLSKVGASEDSTPGIWDLMYYIQLIAKKAPFSFQSDINLLADADTGKYMKQFSTNKAGWDAAFAPAFAKMQVLGAKFNQVDCTSALPKGIGRRQEPNRARSVIGALARRKLQGVSAS